MSLRKEKLSMDQDSRVIITLFGATGDSARRKLVPD